MFQGLSPADFKTSWNLAPLVFKARSYGDSSFPCRIFGVRICFSPFSMPMPAESRPPVDGPMGLLSSQLCFHTSYSLQCGLFSSLHLVIKSLSCQFLGHFLIYLHWCGCYLVVSVGPDELRVLLLCHLPRKLLVFTCFCFSLKLNNSLYQFV